MGYATAATGPKDVVIVIDVSGSMSRNRRDLMATRAAIAVLNTLSWRDFAALVLFDNALKDWYPRSGKMVPMSDSTRTQMQQWAGSNIGTFGGTNFEAGIMKALDIIKTSVKSGDTSMCEKAILFLTDGVAGFDEGMFKHVQKDTASSFSRTPLDLGPTLR